VAVLAADLAGCESRCKGVPFEAFDLRDPESFGPLFTEHAATAVIHCAAYGVDSRQRDPIAAVEINVRGTLALYRAADAAGAAPFVHVGTSFEYGDHPGSIAEETPLRPRGLYGTSKAATSMLLIDEGSRGNRAPIVTRVFGMYGAGEGAHKLVPLIVDAAASGQPLEMTAGEEVRDYQFVGDVARMLSFLAARPTEVAPFGQTFNLASGDPVTIRGFATRVAGELNAENILRFGALPTRPDGVARNVGDPARIRELVRNAGREDLLRATPMSEALR
jgi:nucleoside-diphosphate-sugar epimerase